MAKGDGDFQEVCNCREELGQAMQGYSVLALKITLLSLLSQVLTVECMTEADAEDIAEKAKLFLVNNIAKEMREVH